VGHNFAKFCITTLKLPSRGVKVFKNCMGLVNFFKASSLKPPPQLPKKEIEYQKRKIYCSVVWQMWPNFTRSDIHQVALVQACWIRVLTVLHQHRMPSILLLPIFHPSRLIHTLSLSLFSSTLVARFFAHSHAVTTQWSPTPIASRTGRRPLAHRPRVPAPCAFFVRRHPVVVASPISTFPLKLSRSYSSLLIYCY